ncbi:hypothetical protein NC652_021540 [Populus alba x Populus x berolinensis]|nr:hypothetical protein NC652_021540 [Populus alba x Populus x berolinensis]
MTPNQRRTRVPSLLQNLAFKTKGTEENAMGCCNSFLSLHLLLDFRYLNCMWGCIEFQDCYFPCEERRIGKTISRRSKAKFK